MTQSNENQENRINISCEIFNNVFSKNMDIASFYYKHYENPYKIPAPILNDEINGEIAGVNCFMGAKFIIGDKEVFAAQSCDSAVLPQYRGKGVFSRIIRSAEKQCELDEITFLFGYPNNNSYPGFMKLGWTHVGDFYRVILPFDMCKFFKRKFKKNLPTTIGKIADSLFQQKLKKYSKQNNSIDIQNFENCPFIKKDFEVINRTEGIMIKRSAEYYKWKVDNNPSKKFKYLVARNGESLLGFIIYEVMDDYSIGIADWLCFEPDIEKRKVVLAKLFYELREQGISISISMVNGTNGELKLLESIGLLNASNCIMKEKPLRLIVKTFSSELDNKLLESKNWICRFLDTDVIIS